MEILFNFILSCKLTGTSTPGEYPIFAYGQIQKNLYLHSLVCIVLGQEPSIGTSCVLGMFGLVWFGFLSVEKSVIITNLRSNLSFSNNESLQSPEDIFLF